MEPIEEAKELLRTIYYYATRDSNILWWHSLNSETALELLNNGSLIDIYDFLTDIKDWATSEGDDVGPDWWQQNNLTKRILSIDLS
jgi:hypothetical protein